MNIIAWVILGVIAGAIAKAIYPGSQGGGFLATTFLGIAGAFLGGTVYTFLKTGNLTLVATDFSFPGLVVSVFGAILAIFLWGLMTQRK
jgi:uncharacterized membrane protein YeaQ/YmgE (transglycosylase-associated protein family)